MIEGKTAYGSELIELTDMDGCVFLIENTGGHLEVAQSWLDESQIVALIDRLQHWVDTGSLHYKENA